MAKLTDAQKKRAKEISRAAGVKYPNAWANLAVSKGQGGESPAQGQSQPETQVTWLLSIPGRVRAALAGAVVLVLAFLGAYLKGRRDEAQGGLVEDLEAYRRTRKEIDDAETFLGDDPAAADRWLRERADRRDL